MSEQGKRRRTSHMWNFYTEIEDDPGYASCNYCNAKVYYKTSTSNMKSHIEKKHGLLDILSDTDCSSTPQDQVKRRKSSVLWNFFTEIEDEPGIATCNTCMVRVSWKTSISNLKRHMEKKHPTVEFISYKRFAEPPSEQGKKKRSSILWDFFTAIEDEPGYAICNMCKAKFSYKTSISNLKSHMEKKHPMAEFLQEKKPQITDVISERKPLSDSILVKRKKTSVLWNFFTEVEDQLGIAACNMCYAKVSCRTSISNLKRHLEKRHPTLEFLNHSGDKLQNDMMEDPEDPHGYIGRTPSQPSTVAVYATPRPSTSRQSSAHGLVALQAMTPTIKSQIDSSLLELFYVDFQPLSIVQDRGFRQFISSLNPLYQLPSRSVISKEMIPSLYAECLAAVRHKLTEVQTCCLTTECWITENDTYMTTTIHFIDADFDLVSVLLECSNIGVSHTSENLAGELDRITREWGIENKVIFGVSDNATNLKNAISSELKWEHFDCLVQTLHLILNDGLNLEAVVNIINKIKTTVTYFKRRPSSMEILRSCQESLGKDPKNLILDVPNRWNSMYAMLSRFSELENALQLSLSLVSEEIPVLNVEEWDMCRQLCQVLKPFDNATSTISNERYPSASLVIIIVNGLRKVCDKLLERDFLPAVKEVTRILRDALQALLADAEKSHTLAICTFLDPRFKMLAFENQQEADNTKRNVIALIEDNLNKTPIAMEEMEIVEEEQTFDDELSLWNAFDESVKQTTLPGKSASKALVEVERYMEEEFANRKENALEWWKRHEYNYPNLFQIVKERFCALASSVPCERVFTKAGALLNERRFKLNSTKLKMFLFLNANAYLIRK